MEFPVPILCITAVFVAIIIIAILAPIDAEEKPVYKPLLKTKRGDLKTPNDWREAYQNGVIRKSEMNDELDKLGKKGKR